MQIDGLIAKCYPTEEHYGRWNERAENAGMFVSGFIASIVEEDHMMFSMNVEPDESNRELPQKRDFMGHQLKEIHDDNRSLEKSTFRSAARTIEEYIREYPGWTRGEIIDAVTAGAPDRVTDQLGYSRVRLSDASTAHTIRLTRNCDGNT